ncbi:MAG: hypothetical protein ACKO3N_11960 [Verrucomicrobiota bacterium]
MQAPSNIIELRRYLAGRLPGARTGFAPPRERAVQPTGIARLDALLDGGLPRGELTELVAAGPGSGSAQVLHALLRHLAAGGRFLALVDGADSFDVEAVEPGVLARLLWVRTTRAGEAVQAVDLLLRDRNFPVVALDLKLNPPAQLRRIASSVWHRLARVAEHQGTTLLVVTPTALVGGVAVRVAVRGGLDFRALEAPPELLPDRLEFALLRQALPGAGDAPAAATA